MEDVARDETICNCRLEEHCVAQVYKILPGNTRETRGMVLAANRLQMAEKDTVLRNCDRAWEETVRGFWLFKCLCLDCGPSNYIESIFFVIFILLLVGWLIV